MATQFGLKYSRKILPFLAAFAFFGLNACGDSADENKCVDVTCETPARYCDGEVAVSYAGGGMCIRSTGVCDIEGVERRLDCSTRAGETCIDGYCAPAPVCDEDSCAQPQDTCEGTKLITYSGAGVCDDTDGSCDFDAVSTVVDCADNGETCNDGACEPIDHCPSDACAQPQDTCEGTNLITYSGAGVCDDTDGSCDFDAVSTTVDCADDGKVCQLGECVEEAVDLCDGVTCDDAPEATCDGDIAVTYTDDDGVCVDTDGSCDYSAQKVETDCADDGKTCDAGECVEAVDPCDGVTCEAPSDTCDGNTVVSYTGAGVCDDTDGSCDYTAVETRTACDTEEVCEAGACIVVDSDDHSVNPGDLIITELMPDPKVVNDNVGEYFEVYNTTHRTLHLNGLVISDKNNASFEVSVEPDAPIEVAPKSYFLFGRTADSDENGGLDVDFVWTTFNLTNSADKLTITKPGSGSDADVEIDRVEYGSGTGFPSVKAGKSMQFGSQYDFADHADPALWCHSTEPINPSDDTPDLGTPGEENTTCD